MSTETSPPTATKMWLSDALAEIGPLILKSAQLDSVGEAVSVLDHVRRFACLGDKVALGGRPPVLMNESMELESLSLYNTDLKTGMPDLHSVKNLCVVGGAIIETERCCFPIVVLHSKEENTLILHAAHAPLAALEAEFYDAAFSDNYMWEEMALDAPLVGELQRSVTNGDGRATSIGDRSIQEIRRNAACRARTQCCSKLPAAALSGDSHVTRRGVVPFLSVRSFASEKERNLVGEHLMAAMEVFPTSACDLLDLVEDAENLLLRSEFGSGSIGDRTGQLKLPPPKNKVTEVVNRLVVAPLALAVFQAARDEADSIPRPRGVPSKFVGPWTALPADIIDASLRAEEAAVRLAAKVKETDLEAELARDDVFCLPSVMASMGRRYTTKPLASAVDVDDGSKLAVAVAEAASGLFSSSVPKPPVVQAGTCWVDVKARRGLCVDLSATNAARTTMLLTVKHIGSLVDPDQALVVAVREEDGRFSRVTLHNSKSAGTQNLGACAFSRLACLFSCARVLIVDSFCVSELIVREADHAMKPDGVLDKEMFRLRRAPGDDKARGKMERLCTLLEATAKQLEETKQRMEELASSNAELSHEVAKLKTDLGELAEAMKNGAPPAPVRKRASLLDTLELVQDLHKRIRV